MFGGAQIPVVDLRLDAQDVAHERVDVDRLEGPHLQVLVEGRTHGPEEGLHVHLLVVEAVFTLVDLNWEVLQGDTENTGLAPADQQGAPSAKPSRRPKLLEPDSIN